MQQPASVRFAYLPHGVGLALPRPQTAGSAGADLLAALPEGEALSIAPGRRHLIPCGFAMALPQGFEAQVRPRSGLALKHGVTVLNAPGTIDADYRGEVMVLLVNHGDAPFAVRRGDRVAQLVVAPVAPWRFEIATTLDETERGGGGYGSTGTA